MDITDSYWIIEDTLIFKPTFNESLDNYVKNILKYKKIIFSNYIEPKIAIETNNIYENKYKNKFKKSLFNQPLEKSLSKLTSLEQLTFGNKFNQPLEESLSKLTSLEQLTLGYDFNLSLEIPFNIKCLTLNCNNINLIDNLPNSIEELSLGDNFNLELNNLPNSIKKIKFNKYSKYNKNLNNLPIELEYLKLSTCYNNPILKIPSKL